MCNRFSALLSTAILFLSFVSTVNAQTEPLGGQPAPRLKQSVKDPDEQVAYQRSFETILWAMPASAIYRFHAGLLELPGVTDNVWVPAANEATGNKKN